MVSPARYLANFVVQSNNILDASIAIADLGPDVLANIAAAGANIAGLTTSNIAEGSNLYYTDERVYANVSPLLFSGEYSDLANTPDIPSLEGYATESYVDNAVSNVQVDLTGYATESYVDNAVANVITFSGEYSDLANAPNLFSGSYDDLTNKPTIPSLSGYATETYVDGSIANIILFSGEYGDLANTPNLFSGSYDDLTDTPTIPISTSNLTNDSGFITTEYLTTSNVIEDANLYYTDERVYANVAPLIPSLDGYATETYVSNAIANLVNSAPETLDTLNELANALGNDASFSSNIVSLISDKASNVYVQTEISSLSNAIANIVTFSGEYSDLANTPNLFSGSYDDLTDTPNIPSLEGYATESYVDNAVANVQVDLTGYATESYVDNAVANIVTFSGEYSDLANTPNLFSGEYNDLINKPNLFSGIYSDLTFKPTIPTATSNLENDSGFITSANLDTSNVIEGSNLYYTDERVYANISPLLANLDVGANLATSNTDALVEGALNLYYTDERVYANISPLLSELNAQSNITTSAITLASDTFSGDGITTDFELSRSSNAENILVLMNGIAQVPVYDYSVSNSSTLSFSEAPLEQANIEVRFFYDRIRVITQSIDLSSDRFLADGSNVEFTLSAEVATPKDAIVIINGVVQIPTVDYTVNATTITFNTAPADQSVIEVRLFSTQSTEYTTSSLSTTNIVEGDNLYYTDERVYANISPLLANIEVGSSGANLSESNTDALAEGVNNLYFSNERVYANISPLLFSGDYADLSNTPSIPSLTGYATESYVDNAIANVSTFSGEYSDLANAPNLFSGSYDDLTNTPIIPIATSNLTNDTGFITTDSLTTSNVIEGTNLYYTDERVYANISPLIPTLDGYATENYVDNAIANVSVDLGNISQNILPDTDIAYDIGSANLRFRDLYLSGNSIYMSGIVIRNVGNKLAVARATGNQISEALPMTLTENDTDDLPEGTSNLYYTDARVYANVAPLLFSGDYDDLTNKPNIPSLTGYATETYVDNKVANLVNSAPEALDTLNELATALGNDANFSNTIVTSIGTKASNAYVQAEISALSDYVMATAANAFSGDYNDLTNQPSIPSLSGYATESYVDNAVANVQVDLTGYATESYVSNSISALDTSNVVEGDNLYFTNARVYANIAPLLANVSGGGASVETSNVAPSDPSGGDLWMNDDTGDFSVYVGNAWLTVGGGGGSANLTGYATESYVDNAIASAGSYDANTDSTGYFALPAGTSAQRPAAPPLGAMRYNSNIGGGEIYTATGWSPFGAQPPVISSVVPGDYNGEQGTSFTISGVNFTNDCLIFFIDSSGTSFQAAVTVFTNSTSMTGTTPKDFTVADGPLSVKVSGLGGEVTAADSIQTGNNPTWTTAAGTLATYSYLEDLTANLTIEATDADENATITYSITSGALPTGMTFDANTGVITGNVENPGAATVTNNFEVTATDNAGNEASRSFNIIRTWKDGSTMALAAPSAAFIYALDASYQTANADGIYWIQLPGANTASQVYCCMDSNVGSGGWMAAYQRTGTTDSSSIIRKDFMYNGTDGYITNTFTNNSTDFPVLPSGVMNFNTLGFTQFMFNNRNASWVSGLGEFHWGDMVDNAAFTFNTYPVNYYTRSSGATGTMSLYQQSQAWSPGATEGLSNTMNWWSGYYNGSLCGGSGRCNTSACPTTGGNTGSCHFNRDAPYIVFVK